MPSPDLLEAVLIGAGPTGLSALKELLAACPNLRNRNQDDGNQLVVLEESDAVGGMWHRSGEVYRQNENQCISSGGVASSVTVPVATSSQPVYDDLVANLPKELMCFRDMVYPSDVPAMPLPHHVSGYFQRYAQVHNLLPHVKLRSRAVQCNKVYDGGSEESYWETIALEQHSDGSKTQTVYKSKRLVVCIGHHRKAHVPSCIRGIQHYRGKVLHSSAFRSPNQFEEGSTVLIVGGGISGADIGKVILAHANNKCKVFVSVRKWKSFPHRILLKKLQKKGLIRPGISHVGEDGTVHFDSYADDVSNIPSDAPVRPDAIIFATGYRYNYPFLPRNGGFVQQDGFKMCRLYMRMLYIDDPSLVFLQVPTMSLSPIMLIEYQAIWYAQYVQGNLHVTKEMMEAEICSRKDDNTQDNLKIVVGYVPYCNSLARMAGDYTFWKQMMWIRFPMMFQSLWVVLKHKVSSMLFGWKHTKEL